MAFELRVHNRYGSRIDPVPFLVSVGLGFMLTMSFGPMYGLSYGLALSTSLALSAVAFCGLVVAYAQLVRSAPPVDAGPLPPGPRFERLLYVGLGIGVALVGLTVPLL